MMPTAVAALGRVAHLLAAAPDAASTMAAAAEEGMRVFRAERAGIFLIDEHRTVVEVPVAEVPVVEEPVVEEPVVEAVEGEEEAEAEAPAEGEAKPEG